MPMEYLNKYKQIVFFFFSLQELIINVIFHVKSLCHPSIYGKKQIIFNTK